MSEPRDREWDDELRPLGDVREAYRAAVRDEAPPEGLDAAVLAASRRAVGAAPRAARSGGFARWRAPLAAAAVVVLGVSVAWWGLDDWGPDHSAATLDVAEPPAPSAGALPERAEPSEAAAHAGRLPEARERTAGTVGQDSVAAARPAEVGAVQPGIAGPTKRRADMAMTENAAPDIRNATQTPRGADSARETASPPASGPSPLAREAESARQGQEARVAAAPAMKEMAPIPAAPAASEVARADAATPAEVLVPAPGPGAVAVTTASAESAQSLPGGAVAAADEPERRRALSAPRASTRTAPAAEHAKASPAPAAAPRIGGHDDGVAELREILGLWETGRRDEASLALERLRCAKPQVPIPPDLPVPSPKPLRCPDRAPAAKEGVPGDR